MTRRLTRRLLLLSLLLAGALALTWVHRSSVEQFLASPEADYTPAWNLSSEYGRPGADLTPVWRVELEPGFGGPGDLRVQDPTDPRLLGSI